MRKNHATNCKGCHGQDHPFIRSFWFMTTVDDALDEVAVPFAPWTGVIAQNLHWKMREKIECLQLFLNTIFSSQMIERLFKSDEVKVWMLRCSYLQKKNRRSIPAIDCKSYYFSLNESHNQIAIVHHQVNLGAGNGPLLPWRLINRTGSLWRLATSEWLINPTSFPGYSLYFEVGRVLWERGCFQSRSQSSRAFWSAPRLSSFSGSAKIKQLDVTIRGVQILFRKR